MYIKASRGARAKSVTVTSTGCGFDPHSRGYLHFFALVSRPVSSATQHAMPPELGGK